MASSAASSSASSRLGLISAYLGLGQRLPGEEGSGSEGVQGEFVLGTLGAAGATSLARAGDLAKSMASGPESKAAAPTASHMMRDCERTERSTLTQILNNPSRSF